MRLALILILLLAFPLSSAKSDDKKQADNVNDHSGQQILVVFGDSLAAGYGLAPQEALPAQLQTKLDADGLDVRVINDGVSGDTTAGGLSRLPSALDQHPSVALVILGGNDLLRGLPVAKSRQNLDQILNAFSRANVRIFLVGQKAPASLGPAYANQFNTMYSELSAKYHTAFYPVYLEGLYGNASLMQSDGIHPNRDGVAKVVSKMEPQIVKLLK